jgi:hypothetical protein
MAILPKTRLTTGAKNAGLTKVKSKKIPLRVLRLWS